MRAKKSYTTIINIQPIWLRQFSKPVILFTLFDRVCLYLHVKFMWILSWVYKSYIFVYAVNIFLIISCFLIKGFVVYAAPPNRQEPIDLVLALGTWPLDATWKTVLPELFPVSEQQYIRYLEKNNFSSIDCGKIIRDELDGSFKEILDIKSERIDPYEKSYLKSDAFFSQSFYDFIYNFVDFFKTGFNVFKFTFKSLFTFAYESWQVVLRILISDYDLQKLDGLLEKQFLDQLAERQALEAAHDKMVEDYYGELANDLSNQSSRIDEYPIGKSIIIKEPFKSFSNYYFSEKFLSKVPNINGTSSVILNQKLDKKVPLVHFLFIDNFMMMEPNILAGLSMFVGRPAFSKFCSTDSIFFFTLFFSKESWIILQDCVDFVNLTTGQSLGYDLEKINWPAFWIVFFSEMHKIKTQLNNGTMFSRCLHNHNMPPEAFWVDVGIDDIQFEMLCRSTLSGVTCPSKGILNFFGYNAFYKYFTKLDDFLDGCCANASNSTEFYWWNVFRAAEVYKQFISFAESILLKPDGLYKNAFDLCQWRYNLAEEFKDVMETNIRYGTTLHIPEKLKAVPYGTNNVIANNLNCLTTHNDEFLQALNKVRLYYGLWLRFYEMLLNADSQYSSNSSQELKLLRHQFLHSYSHSLKVFALPGDWPGSLLVYPHSQLHLLCEHSQHYRDMFGDLLFESARSSKDSLLYWNDIYEPFYSNKGHTILRYRPIPKTGFWWYPGVDDDF